MVNADPYPSWSPRDYHPPARDKEKSYWQKYHEYNREDYYDQWQKKRSEKYGNPFEEWFRRECGLDEDDPFVDDAGHHGGPNISLNCWSVLGIEKTDDESIIRKAYHKLAREFHPDKGGDQVDMVRLNNAYEYAMRFV